MRNWRQLDIEAVAGVTAAAIALVLHLLHVADEGVLLAIVLVILALILIRDLRREDREQKSAEALARMHELVREVRSAVMPPETVLIGPASLRGESRRFCAEAQSEMTWFNVCLLMFEPEWLFDELLRPAIENARVTRIQFVLDEGERQRWEQVVSPRIAACAGAEKVAGPRYTSLKEPVSCIFAAREPGGNPDVLLSFWGEPFMARAAGRRCPSFTSSACRTTPNWLYACGSSSAVIAWNDRFGVHGARRTYRSSCGATCTIRCARTWPTSLGHLSPSTVCRVVRPTARGLIRHASCLGSRSGLRSSLSHRLNRRRLRPNCAYVVRACPFLPMSRVAPHFASPARRTLPRLAGWRALAGLMPRSHVQHNTRRVRTGCLVADSAGGSLVPLRPPRSEAGKSCPVQPPARTHRPVRRSPPAVQRVPVPLGSAPGSCAGYASRPRSRVPSAAHDHSSAPDPTPPGRRSHLCGRA